MIDRPKNLGYISVKIKLNSLVFTELEIDLEHINCGQHRKQNRSKWSKQEVKQLVVELLNDKVFEPVGEKRFGDEICIYFRISESLYGTPHRLVFCICSDKAKTLGIMTLFKERKNG